MPAIGIPADPPATTPGPPHEAPRLRGDLAVWLLICAELLTFAILFSLFAIARVREPAVFAAGQGALELWSGAVNTVLLVSASAFVAHAVQSARADAPVRASRFLLAALACGAGFIALKTMEFMHRADSGVGLDTDTFWMFYVILTGFHYLHVAVAMVLLGLLWAPTRRGAYGSAAANGAHALETGAVFWHMVDLLWIVLFPLVYVMR